MPGEFSSGTLRVEEGQIPAVRAAVEQSLDELSKLLSRLEADGVIREAWLGDEVSAAVVAHYNARVMGMDGSGGSPNPNSAYGALKAYEGELVRIKNTLVQMEQGYVRTEGENRATAVGLRSS